MFRVQMTVLGTRELDFAINGMLRTMSDFRPLWPRLEEVFHGIELEQFGTEGAAGRHGGWPGLKEPYKSRKSHLFPGAPILVRSGRLRESLTQAGASGAIVDASSPTRLKLGTSVPYALWHQLGTLRMQMRRVVDFTDRQNYLFAKEFHKFVNTDALKGFGSAQRSLPFGVRV